MKDKQQAPQCAACPMRKSYDRRCFRSDGKSPENCPTVLKPDMAQSTLGIYKSEQFARMAKVAALVEKAGYEKVPGGLKPTRPRIVELVDFCQSMEYTKLGFLFCIGMQKEAAIVQEILTTNGFEIVSAICKVGCVPKSELGLTPEDQLNPRGPEAMCNPVMQAEIANEAGVDFNILFGLCVGHDSLVLAHLAAPTTILAVKDRLMAHNPVAPLYQYDSYHRYLQRPLFPQK